MSYYKSKGNKKNKYEQVPELVIDLHGYTAFEAEEELNSVIKEGEHSHIRIIVGRGRNSENGPVLPNFVKNYLTKQNIRFSQSKLQDGGEGSLEVYL